MTRAPVLRSVLGAVLVAGASPLGAQICDGTPAGNSVAYNYEQLNVGSTQGGTASFVGRRFGVTLGGTYRSMTPTLSGFGAQLRFNGVIGNSRFKVCPGGRLVGTRDTWDVRSGLSVTSNLIGLGAGVGVGYEQPVVTGLAVMPYARVGYGFNLSLYSMAASNATTNVTADTLSGLTLDYGVLAHYRYGFAGYAASMAPGTTIGNASSARIIVGITFADRGKADRSKANPGKPKTNPGTARKK